MGGFRGCPTAACFDEKGFPRAALGSSIRGRQNGSSQFQMWRATNTFRSVKEIESETGVPWGMGNCAETILYIVNLTAYGPRFSLNFKR